MKQGIMRKIVRKVPAFSLLILAAMFALINVPAFAGVQASSGEIAAVGGGVLGLGAVAFGLVNLTRSQVFRPGIECQHQPQYSFVTLPSAINAAAGISFFGDTESSVGRQRTNMTQANTLPPSVGFELHSIGLKFLCAPTITYANLLTAVRDAYMELRINTSERRVVHLSEFFPSTAIVSLAGAAAGDGAPVNTHVGTGFWYPLALPIKLAGGVNFQCKIFFITDSSTLGNTVMGVLFDGLIDRGNIMLDQPARRAAADIEGQAY